MRWYLLHLALALVTSASKDVCREQPYEAFLPLSKLGQAESYCASHYPLVPCMSKVTKTSTTTLKVVIATNTVTAHYFTGAVVAFDRSTTTSTITSTSIARTVTITVSPSIATSTTYTATHTSVLFSSNLVRRRSERRRDLRRDNDIPVGIQHNDVQIPLLSMSRTPSITTPPAMLRSLYAQAGNFISTLCSCIQESQECRTTTFKTSATMTDKVTSTSTVYDIAVTKPSTRSILYTATVTSTMIIDFTTTLLLPEPSEIATETVFLATTTTQYCPATCTSGSWMEVCAPHRSELSSTCASFSIKCNTVISSIDQTPSKIIPVDSHGECMRACDFLDGCNVFTYQAGKGVCIMYQDMDMSNVRTMSGIGDSTGWRPVQNECRSI